MKKAEKTLSNTPRVPEILQVDSHQNEKKNCEEANGKRR